MEEEEEDEKGQHRWDGAVKRRNVRDVCEVGGTVVLVVHTGAVHRRAGGERERPEGGTTLGRSERRSGSGRFRRSRADSADFDGLFNGPASDDMIFV